ncbi:GlxA family transcriptional regulator [Myxococcus sp. Y35]|uniref:GlxA family transcriptional regulator n=1 Tax=Pseudomyxococcus flavus TaxID=3115648 RepID=UPI003CFA25F8
MIAHLVFDGVSDGSLGVGLEVMGAAARLARAGRIAAHVSERVFRQRVVSMAGQSVRTGTGRTFAVDGPLTVRELRQGDVLVLPGLGAATEDQLDALLAREDIQRGLGMLARLARKRVTLAASCSATFLLAAAGVLEGRQATTTWWLGPAFARRFPRVSLRSDKMVVDAGDVLTAGAALAHADLMLGIVARTAGVSLAHQVAKFLVLDERTSQARYMVTEHIRSSDPTVLALEAFVLANVGRQLSLHHMARATATSPRTLVRRVQSTLGTTPFRMAQRLRISRAVHLLETTNESVEQIAARVGYADPAAFRRIFRRETGAAPLAVRRGAGVARRGEPQRAREAAARFAQEAAATPKRRTGS